MSAIDNLNAVLDAVEVAYQEGEISCSKAEDLAVQTKARGQGVPEKGDAKVNRVIIGEDMSSLVGKSCP